MITFKTFLEEQWSHEKKTLRRTGIELHNHVHKAEIDGNHVETTFASNSTNDHNTHSIFFTVNHEISGSQKHPPHTARKILKHVVGVTHEFIKKHNPKSITFTGSDDNDKKQMRKSSIYHRMATKAGGKVQTSNDSMFGLKQTVKLREELEAAFARILFEEHSSDK